ncbi:hypothetical protein ACQEVB_03645 [Pseudonocardia sp. CA-107938]|uniref:hypothetical protein n=1 Tax=Pseudonocardia sp. CA-107938 TaxID=3240021 RepID=UPI003D92A6C8
MWGAVPPPRTGSGLRIAAVLLLVLAAALTLGGSFAPTSFYTYDYVGPSGSPSPTTYIANSWRVQADPPDDELRLDQPLDGYLLVVCVLVLLVAVVVLLTGGRRPDGRALGRSVGVGAAALLVGVVVQSWVALIDWLRSVARDIAERQPDSGIRTDLILGPGAYLQLTAAVLALAAAVLLVISARSDLLRAARSPVRP